MANNDASGKSIPFERFDHWATFLLANLAWVIFAIPIVTLPLGTVGLFHVMSLWTRGKQPEFFRDFFEAIRKYWWKAMLVGLVDMLIGGMVVGNLLILNIMGFGNPLVLLAGGMTILVALMLVATNMYIWSLLVVAEFDLRRVVGLSLKLVLAHPFGTIRTLITGFLPLLLALLLALPALIWLVGLVSLSALFINRGTWKVIRRYIPESELLIYETQD